MTAASQVTVCRNEGGASMMAEAYGKQTGRPGICFVTRGPGATNASGGIHIAQQDSTPMILFVGQVERENRGRDAFQEMDYRAFFGGMAKWVAEVNEPDRMGEMVGRAFATALAGRCGPVVLSLPHDVLPLASHSPDAPFVEALETAPGPEQMAALEDLLAQSQRPMLILGGGRWNEAALAGIARFAERFGIPVCTSFRRAHHFDPLHPNYAGDLGLGANPKLVARVKASDLVIAAGARLNELTSQGYTLFDIPVPKMKLVHAYPGAEEIGRVYPAASGHPCRAPGFRRRAGQAGAAPRAGRCQRRASGVSRLVGKTPAAAGRGQSQRDHDLAARASARRRHPVQWRGQLCRLDPPLLPLPPLGHPDGNGVRLHGLWRARRGGDEKALSRSAPCWRSMATATF